MTPFPDGWSRVLPAAELPERKPVRVRVGRDDVLLYRTEQRIAAISNLCTHQGGPLHRGRVSAMGPEPAVTCPIHGSIFRLSDGRVLRGPATRPVAVYEARIRNEMVELRAGAWVEGTEPNQD